MLREPGGAIHWQIILGYFKGFDKTIGWSFEDWKRNTDRAIFGLSIASTTWRIRSTYELFQYTPVEQNWTQSCTVTSKFHLDELQFCIILDLLMITGLSWKEVFSLEE